jgi:ABC-2 type transport system permease protein
VPIFDQGYQHWSGSLSGHAWRWLAIARHGVRTGMKTRLMRVFLLCAWTPALAMVAMLCFWGLLERKSELIKPLVQFLSFIQPQILADPRHYRVEVWTICYDFFLTVELRFAMVLILLVGPNLISQDLRFNALPLYFSRPLRRIDYFLGKLAVIAAFLAMVIIAPALIGYVLGLLFSLDVTILRDTLPLLLSTLVYGAVVSASAGLLVLALSSLSRNTRYVVLFWLGI